MKIGIAQLNPHVGHMDYNIKQIEDAIKSLSPKQPDLIVFSECVVTGYPPKDLLTYDSFLLSLHKSMDALVHVSTQYPQTVLCVGSPRQEKEKLYNSALLIQNGQIIGFQDKTHLPNTDVFDEKRYFQSADKQQVFTVAGHRFGIVICEDAWTYTPSGDRVYDTDPFAKLATSKLDFILALSASPFEQQKPELREAIFSAHAKRHSCPIVMVNQVGGNDQLLFDGASFVMNAKGAVIAQLPACQTATRCFSSEAFNASSSCISTHDKQSNINNARTYQALVMGIQDYVRKSGFSKVTIGLSGGIDSAVVAALAVAALGPDNVHGVSLPSQFSSQGSLDDAAELARLTGLRYSVVPIQAAYEQLLSDIAPVWGKSEPNEAEENMQSRIRGLLLMALSNKDGSLVLSTGNKSEMAMGYCTLYGDMCGAVSVLADVPKTAVYELAAYINSIQATIPEASICKPPSAELRPNQTDQDSLPPYEILDAILELYIEEQASSAAIIAKGYDEQTVRWVIQRVNQNEYKRKQAPTPLRVSSKSFGVGRRMPIVAHLEHHD